MFNAHVYALNLALTLIPRGKKNLQTILNEEFSGIMSFSQDKNDVRQKHIFQIK